MVSFTVRCFNRTQNDTLTEMQVIKHCEMVGIEVFKANYQGRIQYTFEAADDNGPFMLLKTYLLSHPRGTIEFTL